MIRRAIYDDTQAIRTIWNDLIQNTTVTFNSIPKTDAEVSQYIADHPVFVAQTDRILGYASYGAFRSGIGYARIAEHSIVLSEAGQGHGFGRELLNAVIAQAKSAGVTSLIAGVSGENQSGQDFHAHMGFESVGRVAKAGFKFGREIDLVLMQKHL